MPCPEEEKQDTLLRKPRGNGNNCRPQTQPYVSHDLDAIIPDSSASPFSSRGWVHNISNPTPQTPFPDFRRAKPGPPPRNIFDPCNEACYHNIGLVKEECERGAQEV